MRYSRIPKHIPSFYENVSKLDNHTSDRVYYEDIKDFSHKLLNVCKILEAEVISLIIAITRLNLEIKCPKFFSHGDGGRTCWNVFYLGHCLGIGTKRKIIFLESSLRERVPRVLSACHGRRTKVQWRSRVQTKTQHKVPTKTPWKVDVAS